MSLDDFPVLNLNPSPNQVSVYLQQMRSNLHLLEVAEHDPTEIERIRSDLLTILESGILCRHPLLEGVGLGYNVPYKDRREALGLTKKHKAKNARQKEMDDRLFMAAENARIASWTWRAGAEMEHATRDPDWWPLFITLTVDPKRYDKRQVFRDGLAWSAYKRSLARTSNKHSPDPVPARDVRISDHLRCVANVEHGKSGEHDHLHALMLMKYIPPAWSMCPNKHLSVERRTIFNIPEAETYWIYGNSDVQRFRHVGDKWRKAGCIVPLKDGKAMELHPAGAAGGYITRYMTKGEKEYDHQAKGTVGYGYRLLDAVLEQMGTTLLVLLYQRPTAFSEAVAMSQEASLPSGILKQRAQKALFKRNFANGTLDFEYALEHRQTPYGSMMSEASEVSVRGMTDEDFHAFISRHVEPSNFTDGQIKTAREILGRSFPKIGFRGMRTIGGV